MEYDFPSLESLEWLGSKEVNFMNRTHEERMILIEAARILYPN